MINSIKKMCFAFQEPATKERRYFHQHPELSFQEFATSRKIAEILQTAGFEDVRIGAGGSQTGVVADLAGGSVGPTVALRADIDALPITEGNHELPYRSQTDGVMHACGHDAHIAALLCAARVLQAHKHQLEGNIRFIFQPAEETPERSGAEVMIKDGVLKGVDAIFGLHVWGQNKTGTIAYAPGPVTAASDRWSLMVGGKGGHAATPHLTHDPLLAACQVVSGLQSIISRKCDPLDRAVLSACSIHGGQAFNVIPDECEITGTVRTFRESTRKSISQSIDRVAKGICAAMQCSAQLDYQRGLPPTVNDPGMTDLAARVARAVVGEANAILMPPSMGAEDMGLYFQKAPGAYLFVGCGAGENGAQPGHHHPDFNLDERSLPLAAALLAGCAWEFLSGR